MFDYRPVGEAAAGPVGEEPHLPMRETASYRWKKHTARLRNRPGGVSRWLSDEEAIFGLPRKFTIRRASAAPGSRPRSILPIAFDAEGRVQVTRP